MKPLIPLLFFLSACQIGSQPAPVRSQPTPSPSVTTSPIPPLLGKTFELKILQSTPLQNTDLTLTFLSVISDSRCPQNVACIWAGEAEIEIKTQLGQGEPQRAQLKLLADPEKAKTRVGDYIVRFEDLQPSPQEPGEPPPPHYQATFSVEKAL